MALPWSKAKHLVENGQVRVASRSTRDPAQRLKVGQIVEIHGHSEIATPVISKPKLSTPPIPKRVYSGPMPGIVYSDDAIVVVNKPAGLTTMRHAEESEEFGERGKRYLPNTLADLLPPLLGTPDRRIRAVHRIDKETSGLVVFARTSAAEKHLTEQFRAHSVERRYLAIVRGVLEDGRIESHLIRDRGDGRRGSDPLGHGQRAVTHFRVVQSFGGFSLIECRLETGRTHQVRIHLGEAGSPLCGEQVYDRPIHGKPIPDLSHAKRPMLHAAKLGFRHPISEEWVQWESPLPKDMEEFLESDEWRVVMSSG